MQLLSEPKPQLLFPHPPNPPPPPQQQRSRIIQIMLFPHPHPLFWCSHPHPQFVAAKSLMFKSSGIFVYTPWYAGQPVCFACPEKKVEMILTSWLWRQCAVTKLSRWLLFTERADTCCRRVKEHDSGMSSLLLRSKIWMSLQTVPVCEVRVNRNNLGFSKVRGPFKNCREMEKMV